MSAQPCGCDYEASYMCREHLTGQWPKGSPILESADQPGCIYVVNPPANGPTRASTLPNGSAERKTFPIATGVLDYFPDAIAAISNVSWQGNEQHNPGEPLHWARGKSMDQDDTLMRHFLQRGTKDVDGQRHSAKMAWRALAILQLEIEAEKERA